MQEGHAMAQAVCHHGDQDSTPGQSVWGLWWTKWRGDSFPCQCHATNTLYLFIDSFVTSAT